MSKVEEVARAMWETGPGAPEWDAGSLQAVSYLIWARAAIEAMREPSPAMIEAQQSLCVYLDDAHMARDAEALKDAWETMARAALV